MSQSVSQQLQLYKSYRCPFGDTLGKNPHHIESNQLTCKANLLVGFYMTGVPTKGVSE